MKYVSTDSHRSCLTHSHTHRGRGHIYTYTTHTRTIRDNLYVSTIAFFENRFIRVYELDSEFSHPGQPNDILLIFFKAIC